MTPDRLTAPCPVHGLQAFVRFEEADLWACFADHPAICWSVVLSEDVATHPDGGDVVDIRTLRPALDQGDQPA